MSRAIEKADRKSVAHRDRRALKHGTAADLRAAYRRRVARRVALALLVLAVVLTGSGLWLCVVAYAHGRSGDGVPDELRDLGGVAWALTLAVLLIAYLPFPRPPRSDRKRAARPDMLQSPPSE